MVSIPFFSPYIHFFAPFLYSEVLIPVTRLKARQNEFTEKYPTCSEISLTFIFVVPNSSFALSIRIPSQIRGKLHPHFLLKNRR